MPAEGERQQVAGRRGAPFSAALRLRLCSEQRGVQVRCAAQVTHALANTSLAATAPGTDEPHLQHPLRTSRFTCWSEAVGTHVFSSCSAGFCSAEELTCVSFVSGQEDEPDEFPHIAAKSECIDVALFVDVTGSMARTLLTVTSIKGDADQVVCTLSLYCMLLALNQGREHGRAGASRPRRTRSC